LDQVKQTIVNTTNSLSNPQPVAAVVHHQPAPTPTPAPVATPTPVVAAPKPKGIQVLPPIGGPKFTPTPAAQNTHTPAPQPAFTPAPAPQPVFTPAPAPQHEPTSPTPARANELAESNEVGGSKMSVEKIREEALKRIPQDPKERQADLRNPEILATYVKLRDPTDPLNWMIMGYKGTNKDELSIIAKGEGQFDEFFEEIPEEKPVYMFLNYKFGDTGRNKSVFMSYVPDSLNGLTKARVVGHRGDVENFIKYMHISWHCLSLEEIKESELTKMLLKAGGANYSVQDDNKGDFSSYKTQTKNFYSVKDKQTAVKAVYNTGPLSVTPCDISGRAMVAAQSDFKKNTSAFFKGEGS